MTEHTWSQTRDLAIEKFNGQTPSAQIEQEILEAFERSPRRVISEVDRVASKLAAGKITSAWPILRLNVRELEQRPDVTVTDTGEQDRAWAWTERWMRNAGCQFDREPEILDALFGHGGRLVAWAQVEWLESESGKLSGEHELHGDTQLVDRALELWRQARPSGQLVEAEFERRAAEHVLLRKRLAAEEVRRKAERQAELEAEEIPA